MIKQDCLLNYETPVIELETEFAGGSMSHGLFVLMPIVLPTSLLLAAPRVSVAVAVRPDIR